MSHVKDLDFPFISHALFHTNLVRDKIFNYYIVLLKVAFH